MLDFCFVDDVLAVSQWDIHKSWGLFFWEYSSLFGVPSANPSGIYQH
jgi:hypothetical protein